MRSLVQEFNSNYDSGDAWGSTMGYFFEVAHELSRREDTIPDAWEYRDGASGPPEATEDYPEITTAESEDLIEFGNLLNSIANILRDTDKAY